MSSSFDAVGPTPGLRDTAVVEAPCYPINWTYIVIVTLSVIAVLVGIGLILGLTLPYVQRAVTAMAVGKGVESVANAVREVVGPSVNAAAARAGGGGGGAAP